MVHLQLAPSDSQHKVCVSTWAEELMAAVGCYPPAPAAAGGCSLLASHATRFATSSRQRVDAEAVEMGFSSSLPALCVASGFGLWSALHPVFLCLCLPFILARLCFPLLPFIQVGKFLLLLLHTAWLPAETLRALESFPAFSPDVPGAIAIPCRSEEWSEGKLLLSYLCPVWGRAALGWDMLNEEGLFSTFLYLSLKGCGQTVTFRGFWPGKTFSQSGERLSLDLQNAFFANLRCRPRKG